MRKAQLFLLMPLLLLIGTTAARAAEAYAVLSGTTLTFYYDSSKSSRSGTKYAMNNGANAPAWFSQNSTITKVVFTSSFASARPTSCYAWFYNASKLASVTGLNYLNTSEATNMRGMFQNCSTLTSLDVSHFNTAKVTNMQSMFNGCTQLKTLDVSSFNTANVTTMYLMFNNCSALTSLDASSFKTPKVTDFGQMFYGCSSLTSLNLSGATFVSGVSSTSMFYCVGLKKLTIPATANNINSTACAKVGSASSPCELYYPSGFTPQKTSSGSGYYVWKGGYFKDGTGGGTTIEPDEEKGYAVLSGTTLTFYYDANYGSRSGTVYNLNSGSTKPAWNAKASTVKKVVFDKSFDEFYPTTTYYWMGGMSSLTAIDGLEYLHTDDVTNMAYMFYGCSQLTSLYLGSFVTDRVTTMAYMFANCTKLATLELYDSSEGMEYETFNSTFTTNAATNLSNMFAGCSSLKDLVLAAFTVKTTTTTTDLLKGCTSLERLYIDTNLNALNSTALAGVGTAAKPCLLEYHEDEARPEASTIKPSYIIWKGGYFRTLQVGFAELSKDGKTLTFQYDIYDDYSWGGEEVTRQLFPLNEGESPTDWEDFTSNVTKVVFDESFKYVRPESTSNWFYFMANLTQIVGIGYLNTSEVTSMFAMFAGCSKLASVDLSHFDTSKVGTMWAMFSGCKSLASIDVSKFNTANNRSFRNMFSNCTSLKSIDVSQFNTSKAYTLNNMFDGCTALSSLDLSSFTTIPATTQEADGTHSMLKGCSALKKLTIPSAASQFHSTACTGVGTASSPCELIYPSGFTPEKTSSGNGYYVWKGGYFKDNNTTPSAAKGYAVLSGTTLTFYYDASYGSRSGTMYNLNSGTSLPLWNSKASTVTKVVFDSSFKNAMPNTCYAWFAQMSKLTQITGLEYLNTSKVTAMRSMFDGCSSLKTLDVSTFDTQNVTSMYRMFYNCSDLTDLTLYSAAYGLGEYEEYESTFVTTKATSLQEMFYNCSKLQELVLANFKVNSSTNTNGMLKKCSGLKSLYFDQDMSTLNETACEGVGTFSEPCELVNPRYIAEGDLWCQDAKPFLVWKSGYFRDGLRSGYAVLDGETLTFKYGILYLISGLYLLNQGTTAPEWASAAAQVKKVVFDESFRHATPSTTYAWFRNMSKLTQIEGLDYLNTDYVLHHDYMFSGCTRLTSLDISKFSYDYIDYDQGSAISVVPATSKYAFQNCSGLKSLTVSISAMTLDDTAFTGVGTASSPCQLNGYIPKDVTAGNGYYVWKGGYFKDAGSEPVVSGTAYAVLSGTTLTFYYDNDKSTRSGTVYTMNSGTNTPGWFSKNSTITKVVFTANFAYARPTTCYAWFYNATSLTSVSGLNYLNTSEVTNMRGMFQNCSKVTSLDVSHFNTAKVTTMQSMFNGCTQLKTLDVSSFNTANVTTMYLMFNNCSALTSLDASSFKTPKVTDFGQMFYGCSSLTSLDLSGATFASGVSSTSMFYCVGLKCLAIPATANNINSTACAKVGSASAPCELSYPAGFTPEKTYTGNGYYNWKGGYFKDAPAATFAMGDVNHDKNVDVVDIMLAVDVTLHKTPAVFFFDEGDLDKNGEIDVSDVMKIVDITLHKASSAPALHRGTASAMHLTRVGKEVALHLDATEPFTALELTLTLPEGCRLVTAKMSPHRSDGHQVLAHHMGNGRYHVVVFAMSGAPFIDNGTPLLLLSVDGQPADGLRVDDILLTNRQHEAITLPGLEGVATGIDELATETPDNDFYSIEGIKTQTPRRGIYIRNGRKVVIRR